MRSKAKDTITPFNNLLAHIVSMPSAELKAKLDEEKKAKKKPSKKRASVRASGEKG